MFPNIKYIFFSVAAAAAAAAVAATASVFSSFFLYFYSSVVVSLRSFQRRRLAAVCVPGAHVRMHCSSFTPLPPMQFCLQKYGICMQNYVRTFRMCAMLCMCVSGTELHLQLQFSLCHWFDAAASTEFIGCNFLCIFMHTHSESLDKDAQT